MIFLEPDIIELIAENFRRNPNFINLELPGLREENPEFFRFFDHFTRDEPDSALGFKVAALTYLAFKWQLQALFENGKAKIAALPEIVDSVLDIAEQGATDEGILMRNIFQAVQDQNPALFNFMIEFCQGSTDPVFVAQCFAFAYGIVSLQLEETKATHFLIPQNQLQ